MHRRGVVGRLVQPRRGIRDGEVGPQCVDDLLAVQAPPGSEREELDERRRRTARPLPVERSTVDEDGERAERADLDVRLTHARPRSCARHRGWARHMRGTRRLRVPAWWAGLDSNQRSGNATGLQPVPFGHSGTDPGPNLAAALFPQP